MKRLACAALAALLLLQPALVYADGVGTIQGQITQAHGAPVLVQNPTAGQVLTFNGSTWVAATPAGGSLNGFTNTTPGKLVVDDGTGAIINLQGSTDQNFVLAFGNGKRFVVRDILGNEIINSTISSMELVDGGITIGPDTFRSEYPITWATGLGVITHILGPSDQNLFCQGGSSDVNVGGGILQLYKGATGAAGSAYLSGGDDDTGGGIGATLRVQGGEGAVNGVIILNSGGNDLVKVGVSGVPITIQAGLGAINHIVGPSDQAFTIQAAASRTLNLGGGGATQWVIGTTGTLTTSSTATVQISGTGQDSGHLTIDAGIQSDFSPNDAILKGGDSPSVGGGRAEVKGGTATSGAGGSVLLQSRDGVGTNKSGGTIQAKLGTATGNGTNGYFYVTNNADATMFKVGYTGQIDVVKSIDTTAGDAATIDAVAGRFRKDTSGTTFTLTNAFITANSIIVLTAANAAIDANATNWTVSAGAGSATITFNAAPAANFDMNFMVLN